MSSCKDCIHFDVCEYHITEMTQMTVNECPHFKQKSRFVELPCEVGQTVYAFCDVLGAILPYYVEAVHFYGKRFGFQIEANCNQEGELLDGIDFNSEDIGKTVFIGENAREEAEKALKEREKRG